MKTELVKQWVNKCVNGPAGLHSFIKHECLGVEPEDLAVAGAEWILKCLAQPHGKEVLEAVNRHTNMEDAGNGYLSRA